MSVVVAVGFAAITGHITFEKPNGDKYTGPIGLIGPSVGLSMVPGAGLLARKLFERFPVFTNFIFGESTALSSEFMKWLMSSNGIVAKLLWNSPLLNNAINALKKIVGGTGGAAEPWWSAAIGIVYGSRGRELQKADFAGPCLCYALTGTVAVGGFGLYVLFFGLDKAWSPWKDANTLYDLNALEGKAKGVAVISAAAVSAQIPASARERRCSTAKSSSPDSELLNSPRHCVELRKLVSLSTAFVGQAHAPVLGKLKHAPSRT